EEAFTQYNVVVNCAGLGARELLPDPTMYPIRGQVVRVAHPGFDYFILDEHNPRGLTHIIPRSRDCVLGGTTQEGEENLVPDAEIARAILERCIALEPRLADVPILSYEVGLRPARPSIRVEAENCAPNKYVVHNYGHGGSGVLLSWGCAAEVVELVKS